MAMTKEQAWDYAIGMLQVDGLKPSKDMLKMIEKEKRGEITIEEIRTSLIMKYKKNKKENAI